MDGSAVQEHVSGWGPPTSAMYSRSLPAALFRKDDRLGRSADWLQSPAQQQQMAHDRRGRGGWGNQFQAPQVAQVQADRDSFQVVETSRGSSRGNQFGGGGGGGGPGGAGPRRRPPFQQGQRDGGGGGGGWQRDRDRDQVCVCVCVCVVYLSRPIGADSLM